MIGSRSSLRPHASPAIGRPLENRHCTPFPHFSHALPFLLLPSSSRFDLVKFPVRLACISGERVCASYPAAADKFFWCLKPAVNLALVSECINHRGKRVGCGHQADRRATNALSREVFKLSSSLYKRELVRKGKRSQHVSPPPPFHPLHPHIISLSLQVEGVPAPIGGFPC
ncbi:hypothetical protein IE53DRAFT_288152 [Violaceomyces palustris]|uniref:Uncharacterized protein n=1 Tax=Violaceomyces palustris TaxID=1673888 RepID=A0ACD0P2U5_9BASI|nr:hypothetical protein IE53DRAFT_288152 [Violaceomyces palustris]